MANYFEDRVVENPGRVVMTPVEGELNTYDMSRAEGAVTKPGTPFNADTFNGIANTIHAYGTCATAAGTSTKVVECPGFVLNAGAKISVRFNNANTSTTATMNVNGTGAKPIRALMNDTAAPVGLWKAGEVVTLVYGGTNWLVVDGGRGQVDQKRVFYGTSSTGASTSAKTATVDSSFVLQAGATVAIKFSNAAMSNPGYTRTLNVNSTGAKSIVLEGNTTFKYNPWSSGDVVLFVYDGTNWQIVSPSQKMQTPSISISSSTGTLSSAVAKQAGNMIHLLLTVYNSSEVATGGTIFQGTINTNILRPAQQAAGNSYYGPRPLLGSINASGGVLIRNCGTSAVTVSSGSPAYLPFIYMIA